ISERKDNDAEAQLKGILKADPKNGDALYFLGALLVQKEHYPEGVRYLELARAEAPDSWAVFYYLGKAKLKLKQPAEAIELLKTAADLNPSEAPVYYLLGEALRSTGRAEEAKLAFNRSRDIHGQNLQKEQTAVSGRLAGIR